jgi:glycosyltransferase involved in cell wall biosynthesis
MIDLLSDPSLAQTCRQNGFRQVAKFSWEKTARETLEVIEQSVGI